MTFLMSGFKKGESMAGRGASAKCWAAALVVGAVLALPGSSLLAQQAPAGSAPTSDSGTTLRLTLEQQEEFLKKAKIIRTRGSGKGVTGTTRATLSDGTTTHDASIQTVDEYMAEFKSKQGVEFNFRDSWRYNVAAYRLDRLLDIGMTPPSVERSYQNRPGAFTWWVEDVLMDEAERIKTKAAAPDTMAWNRQMWVVRVFDQLIYNVDRNMGNLLITTDWHVWAIDHTRAFRLHKTLAKPEHVARCDRGVFERLKHLDKEVLERELGEYLTGWERDAVLARRDEIVKIIEKAGEAGLFDRRQS